MGPDVVAVEPWVIVVPVAVSELSGVPAPIAPVNITAPLVPPVKVSVLAPSMVLENEIPAPAGTLLPLVVSAATLAASVTGPVNPMVPPAVVKLPFKLIDVPE